MKYADLTTAQQLASLLEPLHAGINDSATPEEAESLKEAAKSVADRLKVELAAAGGEA